MRTHGAIDSAEVAIVLVDASQPLTEQDQRILSMVIEAGRVAEQGTHDQLMAANGAYAALVRLQFGGD